MRSCDPLRGEERRQDPVREHLANERTLLSRVRTGVGLVSTGLVMPVIGTGRFRRNRRRMAEGSSVPAASYLVVVAGNPAPAGAFAAYVLLCWGAGRVPTWLPTHT